MYAHPAALTARTARLGAFPHHEGHLLFMRAQAALLRSETQIQKQENPMQQTERKPLFDLGQLVATPGALAALEKAGQNAMDAPCQPRVIVMWNRFWQEILRA